MQQPGREKGGLDVGIKQHAAGVSMHKHCAKHTYHYIVLPFVKFAGPHTNADSFGAIETAFGVSDHNH